MSSLIVYRICLLELTQLPTPSIPMPFRALCQLFNRQKQAQPTYNEEVWRGPKYLATHHLDQMAGHHNVQVGSQ